MLEVFEIIKMLEVIETARVEEILRHYSGPRTDYIYVPGSVYPYYLNHLILHNYMIKLSLINGEIVDIDFLIRNHGRKGLLLDPIQHNYKYIYRNITDISEISDNLDRVFSKKDRSSMLEIKNNSARRFSRRDVQKLFPKSKTTIFFNFLNNLFK